MMTMTLMTRTVARLLFAPTLVVAAAVLVKGYAQTGDGFSAGVIAALAYIMQMLAFPEETIARPMVRRANSLALTGLAIALAVTFAPVLVGNPVMTHWPAPGTQPIQLGRLEIISAFAFDVGVFLLVFGFAVGVIDLIGHGISRVTP